MLTILIIFVLVDPYNIHYLAIWTYSCLFNFAAWLCGRDILYWDWNGFVRTFLLETVVCPTLFCNVSHVVSIDYTSPFSDGYGFRGPSTMLTLNFGVCKILELLVSAWSSQAPIFHFYSSHYLWNVVPQLLHEPIWISLSLSFSLTLTHTRTLTPSCSHGLGVKLIKKKYWERSRLHRSNFNLWMAI